MSGLSLVRRGNKGLSLDGIKLTITKFVVYSALSSYSSHIVVIRPIMSHERSSNIHLVPIYQCSVYFEQKVSHKGLAKFALLELKCSNMDKRPSYL